jgi:hypothetical protein
MHTESASSANRLFFFDDYMPLPGGSEQYAELLPVASARATHIGRGACASVLGTNVEVQGRVLCSAPCCVRLSKTYFGMLY